MRKTYGTGARRFNFQEYADRHRRKQFQEALVAIAADPSVRAETKGNRQGVQEN